MPSRPAASPTVRNFPVPSNWSDPSIFPAVAMFLTYSAILFSFPLFDFIDSHSYLPVDIKVEYNENLDIKIEKPRNIIFMISESTRRDVINRENTPNLFDFSNREDVLSPDYSYSASHFTLFSLFSMWYGINGYNGIYIS